MNNSEQKFSLSKGTKLNVEKSTLHRHLNFQKQKKDQDFLPNRTTDQQSIKKLLQEKLKDSEELANANKNQLNKNERSNNYNSTILEEHGEDDSFEFTDQMKTSSVPKYKDGKKVIASKEITYSNVHKNNSSCGSSISNRIVNSSKNELKSSTKDVYYSKMKFDNNLYKNRGHYYHRHKAAKVEDLMSSNRDQTPINNMISPISIKVDLLGHSFSTDRSNDGPLTATNRYSSKVRPFISHERNLTMQEPGIHEHRSYCKTPIGLKIKVEIPSKSDDECERYSYSYCRSIVNQELIKENMNLKRRLEEANSQIEFLKEELEREQKSKTIQICKFCKEKNISGFNSTNLGDYINKQLDKIK